MEHRQSQRLSTNAPMHLYRRGKLLCIGRITEVNRDGVFVAADVTEVSPNQVLEFKVPSEVQHSGRSRRGKAVVVHRTEQGLGLLIEEDQPQSGIQELYSWLLRRYRNAQLRTARRAPQDNPGSRRTASYPD